MSRVFRYFLLALGMFMGLPFIPLLFLIPKTPISWVGINYLLSYFLIVIGLVCAAWWPNRSLGFVLAGSLITLATIAVRTMFPPSGTHMNMITLPRKSGPRLLNRILNEQDVVLFGAQVAPYLGAISPSEEKSLNLKFSQTFHEMKAEGVTPLSPFLTTYLNQQYPNEFDAVIAEPKTGTSPKNGVIFLHGYGGNFTLQCWLIAEAADQIDAITVCPSTSLNGNWWNSSAQSILQETLTYLRQRGVEQIYLAGLSNGAIGASRVADQLKTSIAGLILISGADPHATITELPVLLLHGRNDERIPVSLMEEYASAAAANATYRLIEGDHFLLLKQANEVQEVIVEWLSHQEVSVERK